MQKIKRSLFFIAFLVLMLSFSLVSAAKSENANRLGERDHSASSSDREKVSESPDQDEPELVATSSPDREDGDKADDDNDDQIDAQEHRSAVAEFVRSLVHVADREDGIGPEVRIIAREQNDSATTTAQAIEKIETQSKIQIFFFGTDYKNLGVLRSELVQTQNRIEQLTRLIARTANADSATELRNQIKALENEQTKIQNFIGDQEGKFSLFGWLIRLFNA